MGSLFHTPTNYLLYTCKHPVHYCQSSESGTEKHKGNRFWYFFGANSEDCTFSGVFLGFKEPLRVQALAHDSSYPVTNLHREWYILLCSQYCCQLLSSLIELVTRSGIYKYCLRVCKAAMALDPPKRLDAFCAETGLSFFELQLKCAFCNFTLTFQELAEFYDKNLFLLYRNGFPYAACRNCLLISAKNEFEKFCRCSFAADSIADILQQPLSEIIIRCQKCYRQLDLAEKVDLGAACERVYLVRHHYRGLCRNCIKK